MSADTFLNERWRTKDRWLHSQLDAGSDEIPAS